MAGDLVPVSDMSLPAIEAEVASIKSIMATPAYRKDQAIQTRYRDLIEARDAVEETYGDEEDDFVAEELKPVNLKQFREEANGADYMQYLQLVRWTADVVLAMPANERPGIIRSFNRLPEGVLAAVTEELLNPHGTGLAYAPDEDVRLFAKARGGRILREWGNDAPRLMEKVRDRLYRCMSHMTEREADTFNRWLADLTDAQATAVYRQLAQ